MKSLATAWETPALRAFSGLFAIIAMYLACLFDLLGITVPSVRLPESSNFVIESRLYFQRLRQGEHVMPARLAHGQWRPARILISHARRRSLLLSWVRTAGR